MTVNYTNKMRTAVRTIKNPTSVPVDIALLDTHIELRVDSNKFNKLGMYRKLSFMAYLNDLCDIIKSEGTDAFVVGIDLV